MRCYCRIHRHAVNYCFALICQSCLASVACSFRPSFCVKLFPHWGQVKGFFPEWILKCLFRSPEFVKLFPHREHGNGFSPVWILMCLLRSLLHMKLFPHWGHMKELLDSVVSGEELVSLWEQLNDFSPLMKYWGSWFCCFSSPSFSSSLSSFTSTRSKIQTHQLNLLSKTKCLFLII